MPSTALSCWDHLLSVTSGLAILSFLLYAASPQTVSKFHSAALLLSSPLVMYAIFRFYAKVEGGTVDNPVDLLLRDRPIQVAVLLWVCTPP